MLKMSFDDFDELEEKVSYMPDILDVTTNFLKSDMEQLFINFATPDKKTGYAPHAIPFLLYLQNKLSNDDTFEPTVKNIDAILKKYLELT